MTRITFAVTLLICAFYVDGRAEAKRRAPTRSEAFADCERSSFPHDVAECKRFLERGEAAFLAGRWHPSGGPFEECGWGKPHHKQCNYLTNIESDPEFRKIAERKREEARRAQQLAEAQRKKKEAERALFRAEWKAQTTVSLEQALSRAAQSIPESAVQLRSTLARHGVNHYETVERLLAEAERTVTENALPLGDEKASYQARIRTLRDRNRALGRQFAIEEAARARKLTSAMLRQYSPPRLLAQRRLCAATYMIADDALGAVTLSDPRDEPLIAARDDGLECFRKCEDLAVRAEEIYELMFFLCNDYPEQRQALADEVRRKNEIDRESDTRNLALDRELTEQKIALREERVTALRRLKQLDAPYSKAKCKAYAAGWDVVAP